MDLDARVLVAGQCNWVGGALARRLWAAGFEHVQRLDGAMLDLTRQAAVEGFFLREQPQYVFLVAARDGVRRAGVASGDSIRECLAVHANVIHAAWRAGVSKLCFVAPGIYPMGPLPLARSGSLLSASLGAVQEGPAVAQVAGLRLCQVYRQQYHFDAISLVPAELYGPGGGPGGDEALLSSLIRRVHQACKLRVPELVLDAQPPREFLQVDDLADAALFAMRRYSREVPVNVDTGEAVSLRDLADMVAGALGYAGRLVVREGPVEAPRQARGVLRLGDLGWWPCMPLRLGVAQTCAWFAQCKGGASA